MVVFLLNRIIWMMEVLSSVVLAAMALLTFVDVIGRYLFNAPVFGGSEMISAMLALIIFLGLGIANAKDKHITVELFDQRIRRIAPKPYDIVIRGFSIFAMGLVAYVLLEQARQVAQLKSTTIVLEWPLAWIAGTVAFLACLSLASLILGLVSGNSDTVSHDSESMQ